jgi:hypothetical protein
MNLALSAAPDSHAVLFYEDPIYLYRAIAVFFAEGFANGDPVVLIARPRTFEGVIARLAALRRWRPATSRPHPVLDASSVLDQILDGGMPDPVRFDQAFTEIRAHIDCVGPQRPAYLYGEMVHLLCERGDHLAAVRMEELWNAQRAGFNWSVLCAYGLEAFDDDVNAHQFRAVCRQHTDVIPAASFTNAPDDRTIGVALLRQRGQALKRGLLRAPPAPSPTKGASAPPFMSSMTIRREAIAGAAAVLGRLRVPPSHPRRPSSRACTTSRPRASSWTFSSRE